MIVRLDAAWWYSELLEHFGVKPWVLNPGNDNLIRAYSLASGCDWPAEQPINTATSGDVIPKSIVCRDLSVMIFWAKYGELVLADWLPFHARLQPFRITADPVETTGPLVEAKKILSRYTGWSFNHLTCKGCKEAVEKTQIYTFLLTESANQSWKDSRKSILAGAPVVFSAA